MINFKFVKAQLKNIRLLLVVFFVILFVLIIPTLTQKYLSTTNIRDAHSSSGYIGAIPILNNIYFGPTGFIFMFVISLVLTNFLISKEVDKGYMASWLTSPMSRKTILNSKLFLLLTSIFSLYFLVFIIQLLTFPFIFQDFKGQYIGNMILANFDFIVLALLWTAINWICITGTKKTSIGLALSITISIIFIVFQALPLFAQPDLGLGYLKYFKYFTITSLFNSPFKLSEIFSMNLDLNGIIITQANILPIRAVDFAWQIPLMLVATAGLFYLGNYLFIKKDLSL